MIEARKKWTIAVILFLLVFLGGCGNQQEATETETTEAAETAQTTQTAGEESARMDLDLMINQEKVAVEWEDNASVAALKEMAADELLTIEMSEYGGFEQVGPIGESLPREDSYITTQAGDIVLYSGNQIVVFYGSNSWDYTKLGHITDQDDDDLERLLSGGNVTLTIAVQ